MCHNSCLKFGKDVLSSKDIKNKTVIEVGSLNINGSLREIVNKYNPKKYIGVDLIKGKGVDEICNVNNLSNYFGENIFDLTIATELIEHVRDWKNAINNLKKVTKKGGIILLTTRSKGTKYHGYPYDFWRFEIDDFRYIFSDFTIKNLEKDKSTLPGIFIKAIKPYSFIEKKIENFSVYSIIKNTKASSVSRADFYFFLLKYKIRMLLKKYLSKSVKFFIKRFIILNDQI